MSRTFKEIYNVFKPHFFSNQVVFYNLFFLVPKNENILELEEELNQSIDLFIETEDYNKFLEASTTKKFYYSLLDICTDEDYTFPLLMPNSGENTRRTYVSKLLNQPAEKSISPGWKKLYLNDEKIEEYKHIIQTLLTYYCIMYHKEFLFIDNSRDKKALMIKPKAQEKIKRSLPSEYVNIPMFSIKSLSDFITELIWSYIKPRYTNSIFNAWEFFQANVDCYGAHNINRYFALLEYADRNVYCAYKLGDIYYYGEYFYSESKNNKYEIPIDYHKAYQYYERCLKDSEFIPGACWSMGYMIQNGLVSKKGRDKDEYAEELYIKCGNYAPALNNLGLLMKKKGDKLFKDKNYCDLNSCEKKECLNYYFGFYNYCYEAHKNNWLYGGNNLYDFFIKDEYIPIRNELKKFDDYIELNPISLLQSSAQRKNPWAMDKLACHYICDYLWLHLPFNKRTSTKTELFRDIANGVISLKDAETHDNNDLTLKDAKNLLSKAHDINYDRATFHLAINFFYDQPLMGILLEKAKRQGNTFASNMLEKLISDYYIVS